MLRDPTSWTPIRKSVESLAVTPNLLDYDAACAAFSWEQARSSFWAQRARRG